MPGFISPVVWVLGTVRQIYTDTVAGSPARPARPGVPAEYDAETGQLKRRGRPYQPPREERPSYERTVVVVDTNRPDFNGAAGFVEVLITDTADQATGGYRPTCGDEVAFPCRGYQAWVGGEENRKSVNGYSLAGELFAIAQQSDRLAKAS